MRDNTQIINTPVADAERYLHRLITDLQSTPLLTNLLIQLLTRKYPEGLPHVLSSLNILHRTGAAEDSAVLNSINLEYTTCPTQVQSES